MRTFNVRGVDELWTEYDGFDRNFDPPPPYIAVVSVEGEIEVWAMDNPATVELWKYLTANEATDTARIVGVYVYPGGPNATG
jgi:hypothetical protein